MLRNKNILIFDIFLLLFDVLKYEKKRITINLRKLVMQTSFYLATWVQRCMLFVVVPIVIGMRFFSWGKLTMSALYTEFQESLAPTLDSYVLMLPFLGKCLFFMLESIPTVCLLFALWYFWNILNLYKKALYFTVETVNLLKKVSMVMLVWAVYQLFFDTLASLAISLFKPEGQRFIRVTVGVDNVLHFFVVLVLFMLLKVVKEAHSIKSEQDLVV